MQTKIREKKKLGRPPKPKKFQLDLSMSVEDAADQKKIAEAKEKIFKAKVAELKAQEAEKNVIQTKAVCHIVTDVFSKLKNLLYAASNNLPAQITGKNHAEVSQILFAFIDDTLQRCSDDFDLKLNNLQISDDFDDDDDDE